jgi:hypothetical protein
MEVRDVIAEGDKLAAHAEQGPGNGRKGMTLTATCDATAPASKQLRRDVAAALSCGPPRSTQAWRERGSRPRFALHGLKPPAGYAAGRGFESRRSRSAGCKLRIAGVRPERISRPASPACSSSWPLRSSSAPRRD